MEKINWSPEYSVGVGVLDEQHKQSHAKFRKKVVYLCMAVPLGVPIVPKVILNFLIEWWHNHILYEDIEYKSFFKEKEIH